MENIEDKSIIGSTGIIKRPPDYYRPFSYKEWFKRSSGIRPGEEHSEYQKYVEAWNQQKLSDETISDIIEKDYKSFVRSISVYLNEDEKSSLQNGIDWNSKLDIERMIPKFASKMRDIIRYFADKRESVIRSKLKYNMHGGFLSIERMLHEYILSQFTKRNHYEQSPDKKIMSLVPDLYDVNTSLRIGITEKYDDQEYFDKNPELPVSAYFNEILDFANAPETSGEFSELYGNWTDDSISWVFGGGMLSIESDNPIYNTFKKSLSEKSNLNNDDISDYVIELTRKYIGNDIELISGGYFEEDDIKFEYNFESGNNWFYLPSGEMFHEVPQIEFEPISIHDSSLADNAHGGETYDVSDRIFVRERGDSELKGAWLKKSHFDYKDRELHANIFSKSPLTFRFPFAGYGSSAEGMNWSGPEYSNINDVYNELSDDEKLAVQDNYWKMEKPDFNCKSVNIQRTTIPDTINHTAGTTFDTSDHISIRLDNDDYKNSVYTGDMNHYWLFNPDNTELLIDSCQSYFEFPYVTLNSLDENVKFSDIKWCDDIPLNSDIEESTSAFIGAVAGATPDTSDIIYMVDGNNEPVEAAWLSGEEFTPPPGALNGLTPKTAIIKQNGFSRKINPGEYSTIIWLGDSEKIDDVFKLYSDNQKFSPYYLDEYDNDFIVEDEHFPVPYNSSLAYGKKYIFDGNKWKLESSSTGVQNEIKFETGKIYTYYRSSKCPCILSIQHAYKSNNVKWISLIKNVNGFWENNNKESELKFSSGRRYIYDHIEEVENILNLKDENIDKDYVLKNKCSTFAIMKKLPNSARPYWAIASDIDDYQTDRKSRDVFSNGIHEEKDIMLRNPKIADVDIKFWDCITYYSLKNIEWIQPIYTYEPHDVLEWKKLEADIKENEFFSGYNDVIKARPTDEPSDITFEYIVGDRTLINYWAVNPFTWIQKVRNIKNGVPPDGGRYVEEKAEKIVSSMYPYANMSNRHFPSIALAPDASNFYTKSDVGGYFVPKYLGATEAISKDTKTSIDFIKRNANDNISIYSKGDVFAQDEGMSKSIQNKSIIVSNENLSWFKSPISLGTKCGLSVEPNVIQGFIPYQTEEESRYYSNSDISRFNDYTEPWTIGDESIWDTTKSAYSYEIHRTGQEPVLKWANERFYKKDVFKTKSDIFGVNYSLIKDNTNDCIYTSREKLGSLYYRAFTGKFKSIVEINKSLSLIPALKYGWILDFDTVYDIIFCSTKTPNYVKSKIEDIKVRHDDSLDFIYNTYIKFLNALQSIFLNIYNIYKIESVITIVNLSYKSKSIIKTYDNIIKNTDNILNCVIKNYIDEVSNMYYHNEIAIRNFENIKKVIGIIKDDFTKNYSTNIEYIISSLNNTSPFDSNSSMFISFPILLSNEDSEIKTNIGNTIIKNFPSSDGLIKFSSTWFLPEQRKYIIPIIQTYSGEIFPRFFEIDTKNMLLDEMELNSEKAHTISDKIKVAIKENSITDNMVITPRAAYNENTGNISEIVQVSGEKSQIGAFGIYNVNMVNHYIEYNTILPIDKSAEYNNWIESHNKSEEPDPIIKYDDTIEMKFYINENDEIPYAIRYATEGFRPTKPNDPPVGENDKFYYWYYKKDNNEYQLSFSEPLLMQCKSILLYAKIEKA